MKLGVSLIWIFTSFLLLCKAQFEVKDCGNNPGISNFDIERFSGNWNEMKRYTNPHDKKNCVTFQYKAAGGEGMMYLDGKVFMGDDPEELRKKMEQDQPIYVYPAHQTQENYAKRVASFEINFDEAPHNRTLFIIDTDYECYAIAYACRRNPKKDSFIAFLWILSKQTALNPESEKKVNTYLKQHGISVKELDDVGKKCYAQQ